VIVPVPPVAFAVAEPLFEPHVASTDEAETDTAVAGWVIVTAVLPGQLLKSVTLTV
jgi:hypothetical protein